MSTLTTMALTIDYAGKVVLVTGGTKGVGRGIAARFDDAGATVVVCARKPVDDLPRAWHFLTADVRDAEAATAMVDAAFALEGRLDVLVNNAGGSPPLDTASAGARVTERVVQLNLLASMSCSQAANAHMQRQAAGGAIVNISSVTAARPAPTAAAYGAAKAGLENYTRTTALEWAPRVRVNAVEAGMVRTELSALFYGDEVSIAAVEATIPLGRLAAPSEVGDVCVWLASPLAAYVSGAIIAAHGGGEAPPFLAAASPDSGRSG